MELDRIDRQIVARLQNNAQISNLELANEVGLAPSTCLHRVSKLRDKGVLLDTHATVDPEALGIGIQALVSVRLERHSRKYVDSFHRHALSLDEVLAVFHVTGPQDFILHMAVRDTEHLRDVTMDQLTTRSEVSQLETALVYEHDRKPVLPDFLGE
jgi:DNA-binding Lrp family transcriptional regulator